MILNILTVNLPSPHLSYFYNLALVRNEEVKYYTLTTQVLTAQVLPKIVFYNLLPKSGEYSHVGVLLPS